MILRSELSKNWVKYVRIVAEQYNNTPLKKLGYLKPNNITSVGDSASVDYNRRQEGVKEEFLQPNFEEQRRNVELYESESGNLKKGDYCYKYFDEKLFDKKYNVNVSEFVQ